MAAEKKKVKPGEVVTGWATVVNSDGNEGRGADIAIAYFWDREPALRFGKGKDVMGSDGDVEPWRGVVDAELRVWIDGSPRHVSSSFEEAVLQNRREHVRSRLGHLTAEDHEMLGTPEWARE